MSISAKQVMELRKITGLGMMECKKALVESEADLDKAIEILRKRQGVKADKKQNRVAAEGVIIVRANDEGTQAVILEINSETDFVSRDENFLQFSETLSTHALNVLPVDAAALLSATVADTEETFDAERKKLIAKVGENVQLRRLSCMQGQGVGGYVHGNRIGVLVKLSKNNVELAKDIAMHIAAVNPQAISAEELDQDSLAKEREIYLAQASNSGKPENIIEKMVEGRVSKYIKEVTLLGQSFVKNPDMTIQQLLESHDATVEAFVRYEIGEGIEKEEVDFAAEVEAQINASK